MRTDKDARRSPVSRFPLLLATLIPLFFIFNSTPTFADGMVIEYDPYAESWNYSTEQHQNAYINWENGMQKMILSIGVDGSGNKNQVWIFPLPAPPDRVVIDVFENVPNFRGQNLSTACKSQLRGLNHFLLATQIYTVPFITPRYGRNYQYSMFSMGGGANEAAPDYREDITVYEHVEKHGVTSELVTTETSDALLDYLEGKGLKVDANVFHVLDEYIGEDFSFVVSWLSENEPPDYTGGWRWGGTTTSNPPDPPDSDRGVFVTFPTRDIYFPLIPTSVYGSERVPANIMLVGHVSPRIYDDLQNYIETSYFQGYIDTPGGLSKFMKGDTNEVRYSLITIDAPSKFLTEDLWIRRRAPFTALFSTFVVNHPVITGLFFLVLCSILASIIAGWIAFAELRTKVKTLALIGLSNCLSIVGLIIATIRLNTRQISDQDKEIIQELSGKGYGNNRIWAYLLFGYSIISIFFGLVQLPIAYGFTGNYQLHEMLFLFVFPAIAFMVGLELMKIKDEDRPLLDKLRERKVSTWLFMPFEYSKVVFIPLYSVIFLVLVNLFISIMQGIVS